MNATDNSTEARLTAAWNEASERVNDATARLATARGHERVALLARLQHLDRQEDEAARRLFNHLSRN